MPMDRLFIQPRLVAAGLIAAAGVILAVWRLWPYLEPSGPRAVSPGPTPRQAELGPGMLDKSTRDNGPGAVMLAADRAREAARGSGIPPSRLDDLIAAFTEQLAATIDGDPERDHAARLSRGLARGTDDRESRQKMADWMRGRAIGLDRLEVRVLMRNGEPLTPSGVEEGFDVLTTVNHDYPIPVDPAGARADIVEVRLPMDLPTINGKGRGAALVGYQFVWNRASSRWIPLANAIYGDPEAIYAGIVP